MNQQPEKLTACSTAFKEWACIVESLERGSQSFIVRKGGIDETSGVFEPKHDFFAFFPTYEHQKEDDLNAEGLKSLETLRIKTGLREPDPFPVSILAKVWRVVWLDHPELIAPLASIQVLNNLALEKRFHYGSRQGFFVMVLRVYRLDKTVWLPRLSVYAGCRSWITLVPPLETTGLTPVLGEDEFMKQTKELLRILER